MRALLVAAIALSVAGAPARADIVDPTSEPVPVLGDLAGDLDAEGIDVLYSHASETGSSGPSFADAPRLAPLVGFRGWADVPVDMAHHAQWLEAFETGARGAIAAVPDDEPGRHKRTEFAPIWKDAGAGERIVITFDAADLAVAEATASVLEARGHAVYLAIAAPEREPLDPEAVGRLFVEADHCLVLDTASARLNPIIQFEADLLAELRRQDAWLADDGAGLPPVKRDSMDVVEALGALSLKIVPGGIVLGRAPDLADGLTGAVLTVDGSDYGVAVGGGRRVLEHVSAQTQAAILGFVAIPDSHSAIDIAGGRVTLATPLQDTRIGERLARADRRPFEHLDVAGASKSLIVDRAIRIRPVGEGGLAADVELELRFYRSDDDGHARRLATLRFTIEDVSGSKRLLDLAWSREPDTRIGFDGEGVEDLVTSLRQLALDAALIAVARLPAEG